MSNLTYNVPGVNCGHCRAAIETSVSKVDGVEHVDVDIEAKRVTVSGAADDAAVRAAIDDAGYEIE